MPFGSTSGVPAMCQGLSCKQQCKHSYYLPSFFSGVWTRSFLPLIFNTLPHAMRTPCQGWGLGGTRPFWGLQGAGGHSKGKQPEPDGDLVPSAGCLTSGLALPFAAGLRLFLCPLPFFSEPQKWLVREP